MNHITRTSRHRGRRVGILALVLLMALGIATLPVTGRAAQRQLQNDMRAYVADNLDEDLVTTARDDHEPSLLERLAGLFARGRREGSLVDTGRALLVKYTLVDDSVPDDLTIDRLWFEPETYGANVFIAQYSGVVPLYDVGDDAYYVASPDVSCFNGTEGHVLDHAFARNNDFGEAVEGVVYDEAAGLCYLPRGLVDGDDAPVALQAQLLVARDAGTEPEVTIHVQVSGGGLGVSPADREQDVTVTGYDNAVTVPVVAPQDAARVSLADLVVRPEGFDEALALDDTCASYDKETGELTLALSPVALAGLDIEIASDPASAAVKVLTMPRDVFAVSESAMDAWPWGSIRLFPALQRAYEKNSLITYKGRSILFEEMDGSSEGKAAVNEAKAVYYYPGTHDATDKDLDLADAAGVFDQPREKQNYWRAIGLPSDKLSSDFSVGSKGDWEGLKSWTGSTTTVVMPAACAHITQRVAIEPEEGKSYAIDTIKARVLSIHIDKKHPDDSYVIMSFCTEHLLTKDKDNPAEADQVGTGIAKFRLEATGGMRLEKSSASTTLVSGNPCYSLAGAVYGVYDKKEDAQADRDRVGTLETDAKGASTTLEGLSAKTYYVRELTAPKGYLLDATVRSVEVGAADVATVTVSDAPAASSARTGVVKVDADTKANVAQGDATLAGAVFEVSHYGNTEGKVAGTPLRTWQFRTNASGVLNLTSASDKVSGDALYVSSDGKVVLPLGTYALVERTAPTGYRAPARQAYVGVVRLDSSASTVGWKSVDWSSDAPIAQEHDGRAVEEQVVKGGLSLRKLDRERMGAHAQGDATLAGAEFGIYNRSKGSVKVAGQTVEPDGLALTITTGKDGVAATGDHDLPYGTYLVRETSPSEGYLTNEGWSALVEVREDGKVCEVDDPCPEQVRRGGVVVGKVSAELGTYEQQGDASLAGATFSVINQSEAEVMVGSVAVEPGGLVATIRTKEDDGRYLAQTAPDALPYGTYQVIETIVDRTSGYLVNTDWSRTFSIREDGEVVDLTSEDDACPNQVIRMDLAFGKREEQTGRALGGIPFLMTSDTTGEAHVIVTDHNGRFDTTVAAHSERTNANDAALSEGSVDEAALDPEAGVWFSGSRDGTVEPDDDLGALPFDSYTLTELPCSANEGLTLVEAGVVMHYRDGHFLEWGTIDDLEGPRIATTASGTSGTHETPLGTTVTITDRVAYANLMPGKTYTLQGTLMDRQTAEPVTDAAGETVTASAELSPQQANGTVDLVFTYEPAPDAAGRQVVAFERCELDGTEVASHADLDDEGQTVTLVGLGTSLADAEGNKEVAQDGTVTLTDTVAYRGLTEGATYTLRGTLMSRETGEPVPGVVTSPVTFEAAAAEGTVEVTFTLPTEGIEGGAFVAFEQLLDAHGAIVGLHEDLDDPGQTVTVPRIRTNATDSETAAHVAPATGTRTVIDVVSYQGLVPGEGYTVSGTLHLLAADGTDAGPLAGADGRPVTAEASFTPKEASGTVELSFSFDASLVAGRSVVAFERCEHDDREVAVHADIDDTDQTVTYPAIGTTLADHAGAKRVRAADVTLVDTVSYAGLEPGRTYTLSGTLVDRQGARPLKGGSATTEFVADRPNGTVTLSFDVSLASLEGHSVVAFERLATTVEGHDEPLTIATHEDLDDEGQTVIVGTPSIRTTLTDKADGDHTIATAGTVTVIDTVSYQNLTPGTTYVMRGTLHARRGGKDDGILTSGGKKVAATKRFKPKKANGTVKLTFSFAAEDLDGRDAVAFEACTRKRDGELVARHADISDQAQTVTLDKGAKPTPKTGTTDKVGKGAERMPQTGRLPLAYPLVVAGAGVTAIGIALAVRGARHHKGGTHVRRRRRHY